MTLHTYTPSLSSMNFLQLTVSAIQPGHTFFHHHPPNAHPDTMGENNTRTVPKGCGVETTSTICTLYHWKGICGHQMM